MSMAEYEATFTKLSRFAEVLVIDEEEKCRLFQERLNLPIKAKTTIQNYDSFLELVQGTLKDEGLEQEFSNRRQEIGKRSASKFHSVTSWFQ